MNNPMNSTNTEEAMSSTMASFVRGMASMVCSKSSNAVAFHNGTVVTAPHHLTDVEKVLYASAHIKAMNRISCSVISVQVHRCDQAVVVTFSTKKPIASPHGSQIMNLVVVLPFGKGDVLFKDSYWRKRARKALKQDAVFQRVVSIQISTVSMSLNRSLSRSDITCVYDASLPRIRVEYISW